MTGIYYQIQFSVIYRTFVGDGSWPAANVQPAHSTNPADWTEKNNKKTKKTKNKKTKTTIRNKKRFKHNKDKK